MMIMVPAGSWWDHGVVRQVATFDDNQYYVYGCKDPRSRVLGELGFTVPPVVDELAGEEFGATVSLERSDVLDVDAVVWLDAGGEGLQQSVLGQPSYTARAVHSEGRDLFVSDDGGTTLDPIGRLRHRAEPPGAPRRPAGPAGGGVRRPPGRGASGPSGRSLIS